MLIVGGKMKEKTEKSIDRKNLNYVKDLVSIIMPAYNSSRYVGEAILSVQNQTYTIWELIIVDDYSTDSTYEVIKGFADLDSRICIIQQLHNGGVVKARNKALNVAKGQFVAFLDSDDRWKTDKLEKQLAFMKNNGHAFTFTAYEYIKDNSEKLKKIVCVPEYQDYKQGLKNTIIGCLTVVIDRSKTGDFYMPNLLHGEDHFTWLELMKRGYYAYGLNECLAEYRITNDSISSNKLKSLRLQWNNYRKIAKLSLFDCIYYFSCYIINAVIKRS